MEIEKQTVEENIYLSFMLKCSYVNFLYIFVIYVIFEVKKEIWRD